MANYRMLLIEPDPLSRIYLSRLLQEHFLLDTVSSIEGALNMQGTSGPYAVFVIDLISDDYLNHLDTLKRDNPHIPIILLLPPERLEAPDATNLRDRVYRILSRNDHATHIIRSVRQAMEDHRRMAAEKDPQQVLTPEEKRFFSLAGFTDSLVPVPAAETGNDKGNSTPGDYRTLFSKTLAQAKRSSIPLGILNIGLSKSACTTKKALAGLPALLDRFEELLLSRLRETDSLWRLSSKELTVLLWNVSGPEGVKTVARDIVALSQEITLEASLPRNLLDVRIGASIFPLHGEDADSLLDKAARAKLSLARNPSTRFRLSAA